MFKLADFVLNRFKISKILYTENMRKLMDLAVMKKPVVGLGLIYLSFILGDLTTFCRAVRLGYIDFVSRGKRPIIHGGKK